MEQAGSSGRVGLGRLDVWKVPGSCETWSWIDDDRCGYLMLPSSSMIFLK